MPKQQKSQAGKASLPPKKQQTIKSFAGVELPTEVPTGKHTEVRFTRPFQALLPGIAAALCLTTGILLAGNLLIRLLTGWENSGWWSLAFCLVVLIAGILLARHTLYCLKHAYLILSPVGIEIFPLRKPDKNFRVLSWGDLQGIHWKAPAQLVQVDLHSGGGVFLSLKPLWPKSRPLLKRVLQARAQELKIVWQEDEPE